MTDRKEIIRGLDAMREFFGYGLQNQHPTFAKYQQILTDTISMIKEQDAKPVIQDRQCEVEPNVWKRKGFCPKCHQTVEWLLNRSYCGFCGQAVKWE